MLKTSSGKSSDAYPARVVHEPTSMTTAGVIRDMVSKGWVLQRLALLNCFSHANLKPFVFSGGT